MKKILLFSISALMSYPSLGVIINPPTTNTCSNVLNSVDGNIYFDKNCSIGYVMPPEKGRITAKEKRFKDNTLVYCDNYNATKSQYIDNHIQLSEMIDRNQEIRRHLDDLESIINITFNDLETVKNENSDLIEKFEDASDQLTMARNAYTEFRDFLSQCDSNCQELEEQVRFAREMYSDAFIELNKVKREYRPLKRVIDNYSEKIDSLMDEQEEITYSYNSGKDNIFKVRETLESSFRNYMEIDSGEIIYQTNLMRDDSVNRAKNKNNHINITWKKMPIYRAKISTMYAFDNLNETRRRQLLLTPSIGAYTSYNGINESDVIDISPDGLLANHNFSYDNFEQDAISSDQFFSHLKVNLVGACEANNGQDFVSLISPNIYYEYAINFPFSIKATIKGEALLKHLEIRKSKRKYLFKKIRWTEIEEYKSFSHILDLKFDSDSSLLNPKIKAQVAKSMIDTEIINFLNVKGKISNYSKVKRDGYSSSGGIFTPMNNDESIPEPHWTFTNVIEDGASHWSYPFRFFNDSNYINRFSRNIERTYEGNYLIPQSRIMSFSSNINEE